MNGNWKVTFADKRLELEYQKLKRSGHSDDEKLVLVLSRIRNTLLERWREGQKGSGARASDHEGANLAEDVLSLDLGADGEVLFTLSETEIQILDIL